MPYARRDDVFNLALSAQAFVVRARPFDAVDPTTGIVRLKAHGLSADDGLTLEVTTGGSAPTGLVATQKYGVQPLEFDTFRFLNPTTGLPITSFVSGGSGWAVAVDLMRRLDKQLEAAAGRIDENITAHATPLVAPYPVQVVEINARLAARRMLTSLQFENPAFRVQADELRATAEQDEAQLRAWLAGKPIRAAVDQTPGRADNGALVASAVPPLDWQGRI